MHVQAIRFAAVVLCLGICASSSGQVAGGTILGAITDTTGADIAGATVTVKNLDTGIVRASTTNEDGLYRVPNLIPGKYHVTGTAAGFSSVNQPATLTVGDELTVNLQLHVGQATELLEVKEEAPMISASTSVVSAVVDSTTVRELPLNARDWTALASLEPGVATVRTQKVLAIGNDRPNRGLGTQLTIGGNRPQQNNYRVDGVSINDYSNGAPGSVLGGDLGVDAIQEFSVVTSNASADYGRMSGGVINAITRSGTNNFHGSGYEFIRNSALDARNPFDFNPVNGLPFIPPFKRNQFGGTGGGPIRKDKTFLFGDYERLRQSLGNTQHAVVLSRNARAGQLTSGTVTIDPKVLPYLSLYPTPNG